eukprot:TRINITY_DN2954_c0_g1_i1.p2 TRINITY_DN2954_c0_g1~~TRINITY_DN2954_c0_g1_i1.p2  ORF type:complete len:141 (-),score=37.77 TRINITY_DN2954_c0_g1_i1:61-483(-)
MKLLLESGLNCMRFRVHSILLEKKKRRGTLLNIWIMSENKEEGIVYVNVTLTAKDEGNVEQIKKWMKEHGENSKKEEGCLRFEVYNSQRDPRVFILNERWSSAQALDVHKQQKSFTDIYANLVLPLVDRDSHLSNLISSS